MEIANWSADDRRWTMDDNDKSPVALWRQVRAIVLLPGMVTVVIPAAIVYAKWGQGVART
jgi:hypothetical protein